MARIVIYTTRYCPYCIRAKQLLDAKVVNYEGIPVDGDALLRQQMIELSGRSTVPQIWIGKMHVGGFDDLWALDCAGKLDTLLLVN